MAVPFYHFLDVVSIADWESYDVRVLLLDAIDSAPTLTETTIAGVLATCTECTDTDYVRKALATPTVDNDGTGRELSATSATWDTLGTSDVVLGAVVYLHIGADSANLPLSWVPEFAGALTGSDVTFSIPATGLYKMVLA